MRNTSDQGKCPSRLSGGAAAAVRPPPRLALPGAPRGVRPAPRRCLRPPSTTAVARTVAPIGRCMNSARPLSPVTARCVPPFSNSSSTGTAWRSLENSQHLGAGLSIRRRNDSLRAQRRRRAERQGHRHPAESCDESVFEPLHDCHLKRYESPVITRRSVMSASRVKSTTPFKENCRPRVAETLPDTRRDGDARASAQGLVTQPVDIPRRERQAVDHVVRQATDVERAAPVVGALELHARGDRRAGVCEEAPHSTRI